VLLCCRFKVTHSAERIEHSVNPLAKPTFVHQKNRYFKEWRRNGQVEKSLLSEISQGPLRGHIWNIETNSSPSDNDLSPLFRLVLFREIHN
jgi:hypothetical protein